MSVEDLGKVVEKKKPIRGFGTLGTKKKKEAD